MRINHLSRCQIANRRLAILFGLILTITGCPASSPQTPSTASKSPDADRQTPKTETRFTAPQQPAPPLDADMPQILPVEPSAKPAHYELPDEETLNDHGLIRMEVTPFILISDLRMDQLQPIIEIIPTMITTWDQTFHPLKETPTWTVFLIENFDAFKKLKLLPRQGIPVDHGLQLENRLWIRIQKTDYYTRHLFVHEATHARMMAVSRFQGNGTAWFHEGVAEYVATHITDPTTAKTHFLAWPREPRQLLGWNHFQKLQQANQLNHASTIPWILRYDFESYHQPGGQPYADSWALCHFLANHVDYTKAFHNCLKSANWETVHEDLNARLLKDPLTQWEWLAWLAHIAPDVRPGQLPRVRSFVDLLSIRDNFPTEIEFHRLDEQYWQIAANPVEIPRVLKIDVQGRVKIRVRDREIEAGPEGVTLDYRHGVPLAALLAVVVPDSLTGQGKNPFSHPIVVGSKSELTVPPNHQLLFSINQNPQSGPASQSAFQINISPSR